MKEETKKNTVSTTILGFNRTPKGLRLNTSPDLGVWVNFPGEYHTYREKIGQEVEFTSRMVPTRDGGLKKAYDLLVTEINEDELDAIFARPEFAEAETAATAEPSPY